MMFSALILAATVTTAPVELSPASRALVAPIHQAVERARAAIAALPPATTDTEKLLRMERLEQAPRQAIGTVDFSKIPPAEKPAAMRAIDAEIKPIDQANLQALLAMLPPEGWFRISRYGADGANAAFLIIQHSDIALWRRFVPVLRDLAAKGEATGYQYALMYDRLEVMEGRPQRYGSQMRCEVGRFAPFPIEDRDQLDVRRASVGLGPFAAYAADFAAHGC